VSCRIVRLGSMLLPSSIKLLQGRANVRLIHDRVPVLADEVLVEFDKVGIDTDAVAAQLLGEGVASFAKSWKDLMDCIASKSEALKAA